MPVTTHTLPITSQKKSTGGHTGNSGKIPYSWISRPPDFLPHYDEITMIVVHGSDGRKVFISGIDLEDFTQALKVCKVIVTFNRARFDLPFIEHHLPGVSFDQLHIDMLNPLRRLGLTGGPKRIETQLGLSRSGETTGLSGFDAVRL
jgi:hypothetical protein